MSSAKQVTKQIHEIESGVKKDPKQANGILQIKKYLAEGQNREVRQAALNSLRRIFCEFLESGRLTITKESGSKKDKQDDEKKSKLREYKVWLKKQFTDFQDTLCGFVSGRDEETITPAIRTMIEFTRREWMITRGQEDKDGGTAAVMTKKAHFGVECFTSLMRALCYSDKDVEVEILLMMRSEVFDKTDCRFFAWLVLRKLLVEAKVRGKPEGATASSMTPEAVASVVQNGLDLLRILSYEDQEVIDEGEYLVDKESCIEYCLRDGLDDDAGSGSSDDEDEDDEDEDDEDEGNASTKAAAAAAARKRKAVHNDKKNKKRKSFRKMTRSEQVADELSHTKVFSKAWLALLSLPLSKGQHKLALKHLPDHVIVHMANPLLLADYLTRSYNLGGGSVAVLALQSLFTLIVAHNLDYPDYFPSLYRLCTLENLSAKFRSKFMSLLSASLKSTNLQGYAVAAFIKRLMRLALVVPSPSALFCIAQVTWLLRNHPHCIGLLHNEAGAAAKFATASSSSKKGKEAGKATTGSGFIDAYDAAEEANLEKCNAMQSSLWEALGLEHHHLHSVATLAKSLRVPLSTENSVKAPFLRVDDFLGHTYEALMESELAMAKKNSALAYKAPRELLPASTVTGSLFGV